MQANATNNHEERRNAPVNVAALQLLQVGVESIRVIQSSVIIDCIQGKHDIDWYFTA
jgi:hypothetical protein